MPSLCSVGSQQVQQVLHAGSYIVCFSLEIQQGFQDEKGNRTKHGCDTQASFPTARACQVCRPYCSFAFAMSDGSVSSQGVLIPPEYLIILFSEGGHHGACSWRIQNSNTCSGAVRKLHNSVKIIFWILPFTPILSANITWNKSIFSLVDSFFQFDYDYYSLVQLYGIVLYKAR